MYLKNKITINLLKNIFALHRTFFVRYGFISLLVFIASFSQSQQLVLNEFQSSNGSTIFDEDEDFEDWIEIYNGTTQPINLEGYGLSDASSNLFKWVFPSILVAPNQYLLVWASGKNRVDPNNPLHTNFSISSSGESLSLTHPNGTIIDHVPAIALPTDVSYGRYQDGEPNWYFFYTPSPNNPNSSEGLESLISLPSFSHNSGFYSEPISLSISVEDPDEQIIYTLDGSEPTFDRLNGVSYEIKNSYAQNQGQTGGPLFANSSFAMNYNSLIWLEDKSYSENIFSSINTTHNFNPTYLPFGPIKKANVVRARAIKNGIMGPIVTKTYFISSNPEKFNSELPILSFTVNIEELVDYNNGIYVAGEDFDLWRQENPENNANCHSGANYRRRGIDFEKSAHLSVFENNGLVFNQNMGVRIHGACSRAHNLKSLRLYARTTYGEGSTFDYPFFGSTNDESFKRILVRNSGNDNKNTLFRDAFMQKIVTHLNFETQDYRPAVHYINGEYWGIINIRERYDRFYFNRKYDIPLDEIDVLTNNGLSSHNVSEGDNTAWVNFYNFIAQNSLADEENYDFILTQMDEKSFTDYFISNIYFNNTDWPGNNILYYRKKTSGFHPYAPHGHDGRWRWALYDTDFGFGLSLGSMAYVNNTLAFATYPSGSGWPNPAWSTLIFRKLLANTTFKQQFINRYADLLNTTFLPNRVKGILEDLKSQLDNEIPEHQQRWSSLQSWETNIQVMRNYADFRPEYARNHIRGEFNIPDQHEITIDVSDTSHGFVHINSISLIPSTEGIDSVAYPWKGIYFENVPIELKAIPYNGFQFSHWSGDIHSEENPIEINISEMMDVTANFVELEDEEDHRELIHYWVFDNNLPNNQPLLEIHSSFSKNEEFAKLYYESCKAGYPFDEQHPSWRTASMERRNQPTGINYFSQYNDDLSFESANLRGLQIKQPFQLEEAENMLYFQVSTLDYSDLKCSFAVIDEGAVYALYVEYFDSISNQWTSHNLPSFVSQLTNEYNLFEIDFSAIEIASNNPNFLMRIRFAGADMTIDEGNRITFNNIAFFGKYNPIISECRLEVLVRSSNGLGEVEWSLKDQDEEVVLEKTSISSWNFDRKVVHEANNGPYSFTISNLSGNNAVDFSIVLGNDTLISSSLIEQEGFSFEEIQTACSTNNIPNHKLEEIDLLVYPNPATDVVNITFSSMIEGQFELDILDALGKKITTIYVGKQQQQTTFQWTPSSSGNGIKGLYFCRLRTQNTTIVKKILLI